MIQCLRCTAACPINCQNSGLLLNRLLEAGYGCSKYFDCISGMAAVSVVQDGEDLVDLYFGSWQLNALDLEESRGDTLWVRLEDSGKLAFALNNFLGLQGKIQRGDTILALHNLLSLP